jgi:phosphatidylserine/phosphatidylglycerophosphate/cardiolipin synthase-like enzyme
MTRKLARVLAAGMALQCGCATAPKDFYKSPFDQFQKTSSGLQTEQVTNVTPVFEGDDSEQKLLRLIDSLHPDDSIEIRQFYVRRGRMLTDIRNHLLAKIQHGARVQLQLDFMFSVSALKEFDKLKEYPSFTLEIMHPPGPDFIDFMSRHYDVKNVPELIDAVISADVERLNAQLKDSKLEGALAELKAPTPTPEQVLGLVLKRVVKVTGLFDMLALKSQLLGMANRFHDKVTIVRRAHGPKVSTVQEIVIGGRGWADSFLEAEKLAKRLSYRDLDLYFTIATPESAVSQQLKPALIYLAPADIEKAAQDFEDNTVALIQSAQSEIKIFTPYFVPTRRILRALEQAGSRKVKIEVFTNSVASSDIPLVPIFTYQNLGDWADQIGATFHFYTFNGVEKECFHAKLTVVDDQLVVIGNGNWDNRSFLYDSDSFIALDSMDLAELLKNHFLVPQSQIWHEWDKNEIANADRKLKESLPEKTLHDASGFLKQKIVQQQL